MSATGGAEAGRSRRQALGEWLRFLRAETHLLRRRPALLHQLAANQPDALAPAAAASGRDERRPWIRWLDKDQVGSTCLLTLPAASAFPGDCAFFPDGKRVLASSERGVAVFDAETGAELARPAGEKWSTAVAVSPDGTRLAWEEDGETLRLWDAVAGGELASAGGGTRRRGLKAGCRFSPDGARLAAVTAGHGLRLWDARRGATVAELSGHAGAIQDFAFTAQGDRLATASSDGSLRLWSAIDGTALAVSTGHQGAVEGCCFSADGALLASAGADATVRLWDARSGEPLGVLRGHSAGVKSCAFSPDGARLVSCGWEGELRLFDVADRRHLHLLTSLPDHARSACRFILDGRFVLSTLGRVEIFDPESGALVSDAVAGDFRDFAPATGKLLTAFSLGGELKIWPLPTTAAATVAAREFTFSRCRIAPAGDRVAAAGTTVALFDVDTAALSARLDGHEEVVRDLAFSPDGALLVTCSGDATLRTWDASTGAPRHVLRGHRSTVRSLAMAPDGSFVVSSSNDGTLRAWDPRTGAERARLLEVRMMVDLCRVAPDGRRVAAVTTDNLVRLFAAPAMTAVAALAGHEDVVDDLAFSPDGALLASASADQTLRLWSGAAGEEVAVLRGHEEAISRCAFSPDGRWIAAAGFGSVSLWDPGTRALRHRWPGLRRGVDALAWSPDSRFLAAGTADGRVLLWEALTGAEAGEFACDDWVRDLAWHPRGDRLAAIADWGRLRLLRLENWPPTPPPPSSPARGSGGSRPPAPGSTPAAR